MTPYSAILLYESMYTHLTLRLHCATPPSSFCYGLGADLESKFYIFFVLTFETFYNSQLWMDHTNMLHTTSHHVYRCYNRCYVLFKTEETANPSIRGG